MKALRLATAALLLLAGAAQAAEPDTAYAAYQTGHYRRALAEALKRIEADSSDAAAMTLVGELYRQGLGVPQDTKIATEWYERAAARGDVNADFALASALLAGPNAAKNQARIGQLLEKSAAAGHPAANYNLALALLATGQDADLKRAVACLRVAANAGVGDAMYALATLTKQGRGLAQDEQKAAEWMGKAAAAGQIAGEVEYAIMLFNGTGTPKDEAAAVRYFQRAAEKGNPIAQNRLARLYSAGRGVPRDSIQATAWHLAARAQGLDDDQLDRLYDGLNPQQQARAAAIAASRIEGAALTSQSPASK